MATESGYLGIWVDGRRVPLDVLSLHHDMRGREITISRGAALAVIDIAETGPIDVAYAPEGVNTGEFVDPFTLPQYAGVKRHRVTGAAVTILEDR